MAGKEAKGGGVSLLDSREELLPILEPRAVQKGDFIVTDIEIWNDGKYAPPRKDALLLVEPNPEDDFYDQVIGSQIDEVREVSVGSTEEEKKQGIVGRKPSYKVWIRGIQEKKIPPLDEIFAKAFGKESVDQLREAVRKDIANYKRGESYEKMKDELFARLLALASFSVPEGLVERQKERLNEQARRQYEKAGLSSDQFEARKSKIEEETAAKAKDQVRLYFILQKVADQEGLQIDEPELERKLTALSEESKRPMEEVRRVFEEDLRESMREAKTIEFLLANAKLEEKE